MLEKAGMGLMGLAITAVHMATGKPNVNNWMWRWRRREKATKAKAKGMERACIMLEPIEENDTEDIMDRREKEESKQQSEETLDDAWWLGSMNALTREPKTSWTQPMPQKGATNRFAVLAEPDTHDTASTASHATSEAQKKSTGRPTKLGKGKKVSWSQAPEWCWYTRVPRVQYLMEEKEAKSVCAIAKDTPRAGFRLVEAVVYSAECFPKRDPCKRYDQDGWQVQSFEWYSDSKSGPAKGSFSQR